MTYIDYAISIHAPRVGCDPGPCALQGNRQGFQSTHPVWGATGQPLHIGSGIKLFQSTHPVWGATSPNVGSVSLLHEFQSTHPVWGATPGPAPQAGTVPISIHAPRVGCDLRPSLSVVAVQPISIHAPRVGCDGLTPCGGSIPKNFNPRTPCGVRPVPIQGGVAFLVISIHAPRVGCDGCALWRRF